MILKTLILCSLVVISLSLPTLNSFKAIGQHHCSSFPIELMVRIASGNLSQKYGEQYFEFDCYIRQFVRADGFQMGEEEDSEEDEEEDEETPMQEIPEVDPIVIEYAEGLKQCLPDHLDSVKSVYAIWRFYRFVVHHDYAYQWMRAKIRSGLGYQAERPSAWMDGETGSQRLRLDKLFSNQFYEYLDTLMFKDFLYPIMSFIRKNTVIAMSGKLTQSGKPLILQSIQTHNYAENVFLPILLSIENEPQIFSYTIPGIPLLFAGSNSEIAWSFTGVLLDRSNVEEIQTVGNKFYNHDTEEWISLKSQEVQIPGVKDKTCKFMHSVYGTLYTKHDRKGKVSQYISKWHENQKKNRVLFSDVHQLIKNNGVMTPPKTMEFPFNSIVVVNGTGIFQYLCPQAYPSYFIYPDMFGEPEVIKNRWIETKKKYLTVSNTILTTMKQESYVKGQTLTPTEEQLSIAIKSNKEKFTLESAMKLIKETNSQPHIKKQKDILLSIYRRVKFIYMGQQPMRKQCDQLINLLQKWDNNVDNEQYSPIFILWNYFLRDYTFNYISVSDHGAAIIKHNILSELYWSAQMGLWAKGTSYGECDSHHYDSIRQQVNGTGHNSSCYFNIMRGINRTRQILFEKYEKTSDIKLSDFTEKQVLDLSSLYKGNHIQQAFSTHYSRNLLFGSEIGNPVVIYHSSYREVKDEVRLNGSGKKEESEELGDL